MKEVKNHLQSRWFPFDNEGFQAYPEGNLPHNTNKFHSVRTTARE
jgi:hypothetical protein